jgi:YVTN family beta-propeller protein
MSQRSFSHQFAIVCFLLTIAVSGLFCLDRASAKAESAILTNPEHTGGPDNFGYTLLDSNEPSGPNYVWKEISDSGTLVDGWCLPDDCYAGPLPIGFEFNYYGNYYTEFYISTDGYISFGQGWAYVPMTIPPDPAHPNNDISLFGADLWRVDYGVNTRVYYQTFAHPSRLVVEFVNLYYCCDTNTPHTFEVILYADGDIQFQYAELNGSSTDVVGIENSDGTDGLGYGASLVDGLAIGYYYPTSIWLTHSPSLGLGEPGATMPYTLTLTNQTGAIDFFNIEILPGNIWTTTLSTNQVGPLADGASIAFTAWVEVPPSAQKGDIDVSIIQATSVASPSIIVSTTLNTIIAGDEIAYVPMNSDDSLAMIDTLTHNTIDSMDLAQYGCDYPRRTRLTPDGTELYIMCENSHNIVILETTNLSLIADIDLPDACDQDVAFVQHGAYALASFYDCDSGPAPIMVIDTTTHTIVQSIPNPDYSLLSIAAHPYLPVAYASGFHCCYTGGILVIDTSTFSIQTIIPYGDIIFDVQPSPDGQWLYASEYEGNGIVKIDLSTNTVVDNLPGMYWAGLDISPDGTTLYVSDVADSEIVVVATDTLENVATIAAGPGTFENELTCDGSELYVASFSNTVPVIDTQTYRVIYDIPLPSYNSSYGIAICPQYTVEGIILTPPLQSELGKVGEAVTYTLELLNVTGVTDSFDLEVLSGNTWTTTLSAAQVGPIADGESITVTASVEVPRTAQWEESDIATIQASSVTSPSISASSMITTTATGWELAYVPLSSSDSLALIDTQTHSLIGNIDLAQYGCDYPRRARINPVGTELYVVCGSTYPNYPKIVVLETTNLSLIATIPLDGFCDCDVTFVQDGAYALINKGHGYFDPIDVIDTTTHTVVQTISVDYMITSISAHPFLPLAYAAGYYGSIGEILIIDTNSFTVQTTIPFGGIVGSEPWVVQTSPDGQWLYAGGDWFYEHGGLVKIEVSTNTIVETLSGYKIDDLNISPDGSKLFAHPQNDAHNILVIDSDTLDIITTIYIEQYPYVGELTCDGSELYTAGSSNIASVIDTQTYSVTYEILMPGNHSGYGFALCPQYLADESVLFTQPSQSEFARAGETVTYTLQLLNLTGATDSFDLEVLPGNTWTTTLSSVQVGPIADGESVTVTVRVEAPASAQPGDSDNATIQATSVTSPAIYTDTASLDTQGLGEELAYVTLDISNFVVLVDVATQMVVDTIYTISAGCYDPQRATLSPDGVFVYIGCYGWDSGSVLVIDTDTFNVAANIPVIRGADDMFFTRSGDYVLVGSQFESQIAVIDTATFTVVQTIPTGSLPISLAMHPYLEQAYVATSGGEILVIDTSTFTIVDSINVGGDPWDVAVSPDGAWVFASDKYGVGLWVINAATNSLYTTITGLGDLTGLEISSDGAIIYAGGRSSDWSSGKVWIIDGTTFTPITNVAINDGVIEVTLTGDGSQLYVGNFGSQVVVIDTSNNSVSGSIPMPGEGSFGIAIHPEYIGRAVFLEPAAQSSEGTRGEVVEYFVDLSNVTGITDTFNLSLGAHTWESSLSTDVIGPLPDGGTDSFSIYVTVPPDAPWYASETVTVTADSLANPGVYTATAQASTVAYAPPQISVDLDGLQSTQFIGEVTTQTMTMSNGEGVTLTYEIFEGTYPGALSGDIPWLSTEPVSGSVPTDSSVSVQVTFDAAGLQPDIYTATLLINSNDPLLPLLSIPVTMTVIEPQAGLTITPTEVAQSGSPGETVPYTFTLTNLGDIADSFTLEVSSTWTTTLSAEATGELGPGETFAFLANVTIPPEAIDGAQDIALITATSANDPEVSASALATTSAVVEPQAGVVITPAETSLSGSPGETLAYSFTLSNLGNITDSFTLEVSSTWTTTLSITATGELRPGETFVFTAWVTIPPEAIDGAQDIALIMATSVNYPGVSAEAQATTSAVVPPVEIYVRYLALVYKK